MIFSIHALRKIMEELPLIYEEMVKAQLEIEQLKEQIKLLEAERNGNVT